jgi:very-short-patch-repair endonuclease
MRENTDSSHETRLRLKMEDFGFKGAVVNLEMINDLTGRPMYFDIAYPDYQFSLEYQGAQHGFHEQWTRDIKKERFLDRIGWVVFPVFADDLNDEASWNTLMASIIAKVGAPQA